MRSRPRGSPTRVVSLPCWEAFEAQDAAYREAVLPAAVRKRVAVEIGVSLGWERWAGDEGAIVALDHFGASAPAGTILEEFGFTAERVADVGRSVVREASRPGRRPGRGRPRHAAVRLAGADARHRPRSLLSPTEDAVASLRTPMRVAFAADHGGADLKDELLAPARRLPATS